MPNPKKVKHVFIDATLPELKGGWSRQTAHGEAGGTRPAIARAFGDLLKKVRGKRFTTVNATLIISTRTEESSE